MSKAKDFLKASADPTSLGNVLVEAGIVSDDLLQRAVLFQADNPDVMLGEALVRIGAIDRNILEALLLKQNVLRSKDKKNAIAQLVNLATSRTQETTKESCELRTYVLQALAGDKI